MTLGPTGSHRVSAEIDSVLLTIEIEYVIKNQTLLAAVFGGLASGSTIVNFSDTVDVLSGANSLDSSSYTNSIISADFSSTEWTVFSETTSPISNFWVDHSIFLLGSGTLNTVKVFGVASGAVNLIANPTFPSEESFSGVWQFPEDEYVFELLGYDMAQGGTTLFSGFDSISSIEFSGTYETIPEPSTPILLGLSILGLLNSRNTGRTR
ncbi:PEP-CTERM sorting domain-containing protein [bacterium]|nr:PEP-CTERM sorting domain-containing protein [bacterium]